MAKTKRKKTTTVKTLNDNNPIFEFQKREKNYPSFRQKILQERKAKLEAGLETTESEPFEFFTPPAPTTEGETETETETASSEEIEDTKEVLVPPVIPEEPTETKDDDIPDSA